MENLFNEFLEKDEKIIKVIKPNKRSYIKHYTWWCWIPLFWPHLLIMMVFTLFTLPFIFMKSYKNLHYAYTNKRLIVRSGAFANSYKSLEYKDITSTSVQVGLLDKKQNTGSLLFVSPSSHHEHPMRFDFVENPYKLMNEIKEHINSTNK